MNFRQSVTLEFSDRRAPAGYDHKNLLDGTPALLYYYLYAHVKEAEKKFFGNVSIFFIF